MSPDTLDNRLESLSHDVYSDREVLRRKIWRGIKELNGGSTRVSVFGVGIDIVGQLEGFLRNATDAQVRKALEIMRE